MTMTMLRTKLYILALLLLCSSLYAQPKEDKFGNKYYYQKVTSADVTKLRIIFASDPHGNTYKTSNVIGYLNKVKQENPDEAVIFLFGGDEPTGFATWSFRKNEIGYNVWAKNVDAACLGNHDLIHYPLDNIDRLINDKGLKFIATNISSVDKKKKHPPYPRYKVIEFADGQKILILGLMTQTINIDDRVSDKIRVDSPSAKYNEVVRQAEAVHGEMAKIFVMAHFERKLDPKNGEDLETFVQKIENKDLIIFKGHDHKDSTYFLKVDNGLVPVIEAGQALQVIKDATFSLDGFSYFGHEDIKPTKYKADPETQRLIKELKDRIIVPPQYDVLNDPLFESEYYNWSYDRGELNYRPEDVSEMQTNSPLTALILDSYRYVLSTNVGMLESGNIRAGINAKKVVKGVDVYTVVPFENDLVRSRLSGGELEDLLNDNYQGNEHRLFIRGVVQAYDVVNDKLVIKKIYNTTSKEYEAFDRAKIYSISSIDHFAKKHSLRIVDEHTRWKDYAAIMAYIKHKNKHEPTWVEKYHSASYYCPIAKNGGTGIRSSIGAERDLFDRVKDDTEVYFRLYNRMNREELIAELDEIIPELRKLNKGYLSGLSPEKTPRDAEELIRSSSDMYNIWGNIYPHDRYLGLLINGDEPDYDGIYNFWMTRMRAFILLSQLFRIEYPEESRLKTVWDGYLKIRLSSNGQKRTDEKDTEGVKSLLDEHFKIGGNGKRKIKDMLNNYISKRGNTRLPVEIQETIEKYNNYLIEIMKKVFETNDVTYYSGQIMTSFGKYRALFITQDGNSYLNRLSKFRGRFGTTLAYLPAIFLVKDAGAQYDSEENIFFISETAAKQMKDFKNTIHEDIHILFSSIWKLGKESDFNGYISRDPGGPKRPDGKLYKDEVSLDEIPAYIETISYLVREAGSKLDSSELVQSRTSMINAASHLDVVIDIARAISEDLSLIKAGMMVGPQKGQVSNIYYDDTYEYGDRGTSVKYKKMVSNGARYYQLIYTLDNLALKYVTMTSSEVISPEIIKDKIERQIKLIDDSFYKLSDFKRELENTSYHADKGDPETLRSDNSMYKYKLQLLSKEIEEMREFYRANIGTDGVLTFSDVIKAYAPEATDETRLQNITDKMKAEKLVWDETYKAMDMPALVEALEPLLPELMSKEGNYLGGLFPGTPTDAKSISENPSYLFDIQGQIGGGPIPTSGNWIHFIQEHNGDLNKVYESLMIRYRAYSIINIMLDRHLKSGQVSSKFLEGAIPIATKSYTQQTNSDEYSIALKMYNNYKDNFSSGIEKSISVSKPDLVSRISAHTGSGSKNLSTQMDLLMQSWAQTSGILDQDDKDLLFGKDDTETGIYDEIYELVMNGTADDIEESKFFLILSGTLAFHNNATTNQTFVLGRNSRRLIAKSFIDFGMLSVNSDVYIKERLETRVWSVETKGMVKFFNEGFDALVKYNKNYGIK